MGCDIHIMVEARVSEKHDWISQDKWDSEGSLVTEIYTGRSYSLFSILADVRNGVGFAGSDTGDGFVPISQPKGLPSDASGQVEKYADEWGVDGHSHSYLTLQEIDQYDWTQETVRRGWVTPRQFALFSLQGKPENWCSSVGGGNTRHVSNEDMSRAILHGSESNRITYRDYHRLESDNSGLYTQVSWPVKYCEQSGGFLGETVPQLRRLGTPDNVRIVFFFDN